MNQYFGWDLEFQNHLFYRDGWSNYVGKQPAGRMVINFNRYPTHDTNQEELITDPPVENYPSPTYGQNIYFQYDPFTETCEGILNVSAPDLAFGAQPDEPFDGCNLSAQYQSVEYEGYRNTAVVNDSLMVSYALLFGEQTVNNSEIFTNYGDQIDLLLLRMNLNTGETTSQQIGSSMGTQHVLHVASSRVMPAVYRMGIVRGINTPVSVSGTEMDMAPEDSLYHVYITRESTEGQTEWLTELCAYNNVYPDTIPWSDWRQELFTLFSSISIIEKDDILFAGSTFRSEAHVGDSILYRDFTGQDHLLANYSPWYEPMLEERQIPFSESRIYKIDGNGNVLGKLSTRFMVGQYFDATFGQETKLIEMGNRMAWLQAYQAVNDTAAIFTYTAQDGSVQNAPIDLPAGKGIVIIWLDDELQILDYWVIPFENDISQGMRINSIVPYHGDTLIIQGVLYANTTTDLDPFGESEPIVASELSSFFAFYAVPGIFTNTKPRQRLTRIKIYPNPASEYIRLSGLPAESAKYRIVDLAGRLIEQGSVDEGQKVSVANLASGMYLLSVETGGSVGTQRFLVE